MANKKRAAKKAAAETPTHRLARYIKQHGDVYAGATDDARELADAEGIDFDELVTTDATA